MAARLYNNPAFKTVLEAFIANAQDKLPVEFVSRIQGADNLPGLIGILFDLTAASPKHASFLFHLLGQLLEDKGGKYKLLGEFVHMIPATADTLRLVTGKTEESARSDLVAAWNTYKNHPTGGTTALGAIMAAITPAAAPAAASAPKSTLSRVQAKLTGNTYTPEMLAVLTRLFTFCEDEAQPGTDLFSEELEGVAGATALSIVDTIRDANGLEKLLGDADFAAAYKRYEAMRKLERDGLQNGNNRDLWKVEAKAFVCLLYPVIEFLLIGHADRHPESAMKVQIADFLDRLNLTFGTPSSTAHEKARVVKKKVAAGLRGMGFFGGATGLYVLVALAIAAFAPQHLSAFAFGSTWVGLGSCAVLLMVLAFVSGPLQIAVGTVLMIFVSTGLTAAWILTGIFSPAEGWFTNAWFALLAVTLFDLVIVTLIQGGVHGLAAIPGLLSLFIKDKVQLKAVMDAIVKWLGLTQFSTTIAMAATLLMAPLMIATMAGISTAWRIGGLLVIVFPALALAQMRRASNQGDNPELKKFFDQWDVTKAKMAKNTALYMGAAVMIVFLITAFLGGQETVIKVRDGMRDAVIRSVDMTDTVTRGALDDAEAKVNNTRAPATNSSSTNSANEAQRRKDLKALDRVYDGDYCKDHTGYPCK